MNEGEAFTNNLQNLHLSWHVSISTEEISSQ